MKHHGHVYHKIYYHLVWATKERTPVLTPNLEGALKKYLRMKSLEIEIDLLEVNGIEDHLHVVVKTQPNQCPSDIVQRLKGSSSHYINHEYLPANSPSSLHWQKGYGVLSFSEKDLPFVREYVQKQKEHHKNWTLVHKMERTDIFDETP
ncbi:MAG: IS200/IS605 family transposase [bacterium]|nr:IS200/IS605 family transposase [bacterium]